MSDDDSDNGNVDFDTQLRLEEEERKRAAADADSGDKKRTRTDEDGTVFEWDEQKRAWFPQLDTDTLVNYHLNYGVQQQEQQQEQQPGADFNSLSAEEQAAAREYWDNYYSSEQYRLWYESYVANGDANNEADSTDNATTSQQQQQQEQEASKKKRKNQQQQQEWFEVSDEQNRYIYVQNLPKDLTEQEFLEFVTKCGMVLHDPLTHKPKVKLYHDTDGNFNGDARCGYIRVESVQLALQILDGSCIRDCTVSVERARFQPRDNYDATKRRRLTNKEKRQVKEQQQKLLAWKPELSVEAERSGAGVAQRSDRVLVVHNAFDPNSFIADPLLSEQVRSQITERCQQFGTVRRCVLHENNADGVLTVNFAQPSEAATAVSQLNGRVFLGRVLKAEIWDGRTKFHVKETEEQAALRRQVWEKQVLGES